MADRFTVLILLGIPLAPGGSINHFANLAHSFADDSMRLLIAAPNFDDPAVARPFAGSAAELLNVPALNSRRAAYIPAIATLARLLRRERVDILHSVWAKGDVLGAVAASLARVPHQLSSVEVHYLATGRARRAIYRSLFRAFVGPRLDAVVTLSPQSAQDFRGQVRYGGRVEVIPLGIDLELHQPLPRRSADGRTVYGALGRMIPEKGFDLLLGAFAEVMKHDSGALLRLAGGGPEEAALRRTIAALGIADRVEMVGWVDDVRAFFADIDVFVFPSRPAFDGLPNVILEAMAAGRLTVATNVGGVASVIEDGLTGLLVPPLDVAALAAAMLGARDGGEALRDAASLWIHERHDRRAEAATISALYKSLLDRPA